MRPLVRRAVAAVLILLCAPALSASGELSPIPTAPPASGASPGAQSTVVIILSDNTSAINRAERKLRWQNTAVIGGATLAVGVYGAKHWWSTEVTSSFGTRNEGWFGQGTNAGGADKLGHAFTTYSGTRILARVFEGLGNTPGDSLRLAGWTSLGILTGVEVMDGFSSKWRFSYEDTLFNAAGVAVALLLEKHPSIDTLLDFRLLYRRSEEDRLRGQTSPSGDYSGQTYLLAFKADGVPLFRDAPLVRYLELLVGYGARGYEVQRNPHRLVYYGVGINLSRVLGDTLFRGGLKGGKIEGATDTLLELFEIPGTAALANRRL